MHRALKRLHLPFLLAAVALLALRGNAGEPAAPPPAEKAAPPAAATPATPPPPPVEEKGPPELPPGERGSADNNITFPVDI